MVDGIETLVGYELNDEVVHRIKYYFKWTAFTEGVNKVHLTPSGGVHSSGRETLKRCVMFEIVRNYGYYIVHMNDYGKGVIFHVHASVNNKDHSKDKEVAVRLYKEVKTIFEQ